MNLQWGGEGDMTEVGKFVSREELRIEITLGSKGKAEAVVNVVPEVFTDLRLDELVENLFREAKLKLNQEGFHVNG